MLENHWAALLEDQPEWLVAAAYDAALNHRQDSEVNKDLKFLIRSSIGDRLAAHFCPPFSLSFYVGLCTTIMEC
jgi:hypothetical protein